MRRTQLLCFALVLTLCTTASLADSITPASQNFPNAVPNEVIEFQKTVTINQIATTNLDVFFLFDTTGTMTGLIDQAIADATTIVNSLSSVYGAGLGIGVGHYQDWPVAPFGIPTGGVTIGGTFFPEYTPWELRQSITTSTAAAIAAIQGLPTDTASLPSDAAESSLYALTQAALPATGWRPNTARVIVWFGDAPGWDGDYSGPNATYPDGVSVPDVISALNAQSIIVEAVSSVSGIGLDGTFDGSILFGLPGGSVVLGPGQATAIAAGTGGGPVSTFDTGTDSIVTAILDAVETGFEQYQFISLDTSDFPAGAGTIEFKRAGQADWSDQVYIGPDNPMWDRSVERTFLFDVRITLGPDDDVFWQFPVYALLDGNRVAIEWDTITVGDPIINPNQIPEPSTLGLMGLGLLGFGIAVRRKMRK